MACSGRAVRVCLSPLKYFFSMSELIVSAPLILDFENTNESIAALLKSKGRKSFTLICDKEHYYCPQQQIIKPYLYKNPRKLKSVSFFSKILSHLLPTKYQNFIYTSSLKINDLEFEILERIKLFDRELGSIISSMNDLEIYIDDFYTERIHSTMKSFMNTHLYQTIPENIPKKLFILNLKDYFRYYFYTQKLIEKHDIDGLFIYNGRMPRYAAAYHCALNNRIKKVTFYESTITDKEAYMLFNKPIHYITSISEDIRSYFNANKLRRDLGYIYIGRRLSGGNTGSLINFHRSRLNKSVSQSSNNLIRKLKKNSQPIISIFTSSEHERASLKENRPLGEVTIYSCLEKLIKYQIFPKKYKLVLRVHPHLKKRDVVYQKKIKEFCFKNDIFYIGAEDKLDSYLLMSESKFCISFGSMVSAEASLLKIPSISLGPTWFDQFNCTFKPNSINDLKKFLSQGVDEEHLLIMKNNALDFFSTIYTFSRKNIKSNSLKFSLYVKFKKFIFLFFSKYYKILFLTKKFIFPNSLNK